MKHKPCKVNNIHGYLCLASFTLSKHYVLKHAIECFLEYFTFTIYTLIGFAVIQYCGAPCEIRYYYRESHCDSFKNLYTSFDCSKNKRKTEVYIPTTTYTSLSQLYTTSDRVVTLTFHGTKNGVLKCNKTITK